MTRRTILPAAALAAVALAAPAAGDETVPFDAKKAEALAAAERAFVDAVHLAAYRAAGRHSPKWDADAEAALKANRDRICGPVWERGAAEARLRAAAAAAAEAGCDDPLVSYLHARWGPPAADGGPAAPADPDEWAGLHLRAARGLAASQYPPSWAASAYLGTIEALHDGPDAHQPEAVGLIDRCRAQAFAALAAAARDTGRPARGEVVALCRQAIREGGRARKRKEWYDRLAADVLAGLPKDDPLPDLVAGLYLIEAAWAARGSGPAATVSARAWEAFKDRLTQAEARLTAAWEADHECAAAASNMVTVCMGLGRDRETMETWFRRAVAADPLRTDAYDRKFQYLMPRWHGSAAALLEYGRQAAKACPWDLALPTLLLRAHEEAAAADGDATGYWRRDAVWAEVGPLLEEVKKRYPKSPLGASTYLYYARKCGRNGAAADRYLRALKLPPDPAPFRGRANLAVARLWAEGEAGRSGDDK